jgi:hypothetical protein
VVVVRGLQCQGRELALGPVMKNGPLPVNISRIFMTTWLALAGACSGGESPEPTPAPAAPPPAPAPAAEPQVVDSRPPPMTRPVPYWAAGRTEREVDAVDAQRHGQIIVDLGEEWTPYLFTERGNDTEPVVPNNYRRTFLALAQGDFPNDAHGDRAREDEYLELFGIPPTLGVLRERAKTLAAAECVAGLDLAPIVAFSGSFTYQSNPQSLADARRFDSLDAQMRRLLGRLDAVDVSALNRDTLSDADKALVAQYERIAPKQLAIRAMQGRLRCEGYMRGLGRTTPGAFDWATHLALQKFEKRHRIYGWGAATRETLVALRKPTLELEREDVIRVLTERAMLAAGVLEDGSTSTLSDGNPRTFRGRDGTQHPIPNLEEGVRTKVIEAFGLQTPESTLAFLDGLGELPKDGARYVAIDGPEMPEYYDGNMDLTVEVDRGDVWYDFPYDEQGRPVAQPVERRPHVNIFATYLGQRIPIARYGTTIGGWRSEFIDNLEWWKYKGSSVGPVIWSEIVSAPVWIPPESTPPRELLERAPRGSRQPYRQKVHETGPSYASAYGLVAAYHRPYVQTADGELRVTGDEGIRTHGSVNYTSIMRLHSHGCHRLHNHIAIRLMSFVLAHRRHERRGAQNVNWTRVVEYKEEEYELKVESGGYVFRLERPIRVEVLEGRVRGDQTQPVTVAIPKFDADAGAYLMPDRTPVAFRDGELVPLGPPLPGEGEEALTEAAIEAAMQAAAAEAERAEQGESF